jgi:signal transduction histidine kinase
MAEPSHGLLTDLQQAKLDAMKELAYGASHEVNNPLANISVRAQSLLRDETDPERRRTLEAIDQQALRAHEMISDLMLFARPPKVVAAEFSPGELTGRVAEEFRAAASRQGIAVEVEVADDLPAAWGDDVQIGVALQAIVRNAIEAIGRDGTIAIKVLQRGGSPPTIRWEVRDDGPGIPEEIRGQIWDPFYSGREAGRGLGFGLPKCWRIMKEHGGEVQIVCPPTGGTVVTLTLPVAAKSPAA